MTEEQKSIVLNAINDAMSDVRGNADQTTFLELRAARDIVEAQ